MYQDIFQGLNQGLKNMNIGGEFAGLIPLHDFDFRTPVAQSFPTTAAALATLLGDANATASSIWTCQETSGNLIDRVGSVDLSASGSPLQGQGAYGIGGGDYVSRKAIEAVGHGNSDGFAAASSSSCDPGSGSFAVLVVFRFAQGIPSSNYCLVEKRNNSFGAGFELRFTTGGAPTFLIEESGGTTATCAPTGDCTDGAWHYALVVRDATGGNIYSFSDLDPTGATAAHVAGSITSTNSLAVLGAAANRGGISGQICYCAYFEGAAAEALTGGAGNFWTHGSDPTGLLTTQSRASLISVPVAADKVAHFTDDTLPIGYHSALNSGAGGFGLYCNNAVTNLVDYSEALSNWGGSGTTKTDNAADAPDGFRSATELLATTNNAPAFDDATVVAETTYTYSVWIKRSGGTDVDGSIEIYDNNNTATIATQAYTATDTWQLVTVTGDSGVGNTSMRYYVRINTNTEAVYAWGAQLNEGTGRGAYIRTTGSSASTVEADTRSTDKVPTDLCRVDSDFVRVIGAGATAGIWDTESSIDRRVLYVSVAGALGTQGRDNVGTIWVSHTGGTITTDAAHAAVLRWDIDAGDLPENATYTANTHLDGTEVGIPDTDTSTAAESLRDMLIGRLVSAGGSLDGFVERIRIYDEVGDEPQ